ncbi:MAG: hypothetical protein GX663_00435 [Clostridiales bacterium]|nr:hypothetical protein [Clostridiales bacterium]
MKTRCEISSLNIESQQILLKIVNISLCLNSRVICCTSKYLKSLAESGDSYPELFYALEVNSISVPPLRSKGNDILLFSQHFLAISNKKAHRDITLSRNMYNAFLNYTWPGNIRELENTITYIVEQSSIDEVDLDVEQLPSPISLTQIKALTTIWNMPKKNLIIQALNEFAGDTNSKTLIAKKLGISTATLYRKLAKYEITSAPNFK